MIRACFLHSQERTQTVNSKSKHLQPADIIYTQNKEFSFKFSFNYHQYQPVDCLCNKISVSFPTTRPEIVVVAVVVVVTAITHTVQNSGRGIWRRGLHCSEWRLICQSKNGLRDSPLLIIDNSGSGQIHKYWRLNHSIWLKSNGTRNLCLNSYTINNYDIHNNLYYLSK